MTASTRAEIVQHRAAVCQECYELDADWWWVSVTRAGTPVDCDHQRQRRPRKASKTTKTKRRPPWWAR